MKNRIASILLALGALAGASVVAAPAAQAYTVIASDCKPAQRLYYGAYGPYWVKGRECYRYHTVVEKNQYGLVNGWYFTPLQSWIAEVPTT